MRSISLILLISLFFFAGCGQPKGTVSGTITWKGQPIADGVIEFHPLDDKTLPITPVVIKDGAYTVKVPVGRMQVRVSGSEKVGVQYPSGPQGPAVEIFKEVIPFKYNAKSELEFTVKKGKQTYDFKE